MSLDSENRTEQVYGIGLGSNLGDRLNHLRAGREGLLSRLKEATLLACSSVYETEPVDCPPSSAPFLNAVIEIACKDVPREVLECCQLQESNRGREDGEMREVNSPRPLDLDILYAGSVILNEPDLHIPHPRISERAFVLVPLCEIRPSLLLPGMPSMVADLVEAAEKEPIEPEIYVNTW